jgi:hypothetical protein
MMGTEDSCACNLPIAAVPRNQEWAPIGVRVSGIEYSADAPMNLDPTDGRPVEMVLDLAA